MDYIGIDVHLGESQICMLTEQGGILECRIRTQPDRFAELLGERTRARFISLMRALLRGEGLRVRGGMASKFLTRWLLVEAAWGVIRHAYPDTAEPRAWAPASPCAEADGSPRYRIESILSQVESGWVSANRRLTPLAKRIERWRLQTGEEYQ